MKTHHLLNDQDTPRSEWRENFFYSVNWSQEGNESYAEFWKNYNWYEEFWCNSQRSNHSVGTL